MPYTCQEDIFYFSNYFLSSLPSKIHKELRTYRSLYQPISAAKHATATINSDLPEIFPPGLHKYLRNSLLRDDAVIASQKFTSSVRANSILLYIYPVVNRGDGVPNIRLNKLPSFCAKRLKRIRNSKTLLRLSQMNISTM